MTHSRSAELARVRAASDLTDEDCQVWFGVGLATLERVEAGEIVPDDELEARIDRFLQFRGGGRSPSLAAAPGSLAGTRGDPTGGGGCDTPAANFGNDA
jgi:hypothetical protein